MWPSSVGGGRILRRTMSVCLSVCPSVCLSVCPSVPFAEVVLLFLFTFYSRTVLRANIQNRKKLLFSLMGQLNVCTFRHAQRAAYRTAISLLLFLWTDRSTGHSDNLLFFPNPSGSLIIIIIIISFVPRLQ